MGMRRVKKRFVLSAVLSLYALLTSVYLGPARAQELDKSAWPTKEWLTSTPEEQGMDSSALAKLVAFGGSHSFDSLLVVRHGRIVTGRLLRSLHGGYSARDPLFNKGGYSALFSG